jgi:hypothetical protein
VKGDAAVAANCYTNAERVPSSIGRVAAEFIAYAKVNPGKINFASPGVGTRNQLFSLGITRLRGQCRLRENAFIASGAPPRRLRIDMYQQMHQLLTAQEKRHCPSWR